MRSWPAVAADGITEAELERARNLATVGLWKKLAAIDGKAQLLGEYEVFHGDWAKLFDAPARIAAVSCEELRARRRGDPRRAAPDARSIGSVGRCSGRGTGHRSGEQQRMTVRVPAHERLSLGNGVALIMVPRRDVPLVAFNAVLRGGGLGDPSARPGVASVVAGLLEKGAGERNAYAFADVVEGVGGSFGAGAGPEAITSADSSWRATSS